MNQQRRVRTEIEDQEKVLKAEKSQGEDNQY